MGAMESEPNAAQLLAAAAAMSEDGGEPEPERKRLKKVDFRYTTYVGAVSPLSGAC